MSFNCFSFINELSYPRYSGTANENKAASIILKKAEEIGLKTTLMDFVVNHYNIEKTSLIINGKEYLATSIANSKATSNEGIEGELIYINDLSDAKTKNIDNKICLIHERNIDFNFYKYLINHNIKGIIFCDGNIYNEPSLDELEPFSFKERF